MARATERDNGGGRGVVDQGVHPLYLFPRSAHAKGMLEKPWWYDSPLKAVRVITMKGKCEGKKFEAYTFWTKVVGDRKVFNYSNLLTCFTAALKAPRIPAAPPQSLFIPSIEVCKMN